MEKLCKGKAPEPERESQLATKLLSLWAHGMPSAVLVRELADLVMQDKADHVELVALAKAGNWGSQKGSGHKQILNRFYKKFTMPDPFHVSVSCIEPKTSRETKEDAAIFLPLLVFAGLGKDHPDFLQQMCHLGKGQLEEFWEGVKATGDDRLNGHPMTLDKEWESYTIPLFLRGEDPDNHPLKGGLEKLTGQPLHPSRFKAVL